MKSDKSNTSYQSSDAEVKKMGDERENSEENEVNYEYDSDDIKNESESPDFDGDGQYSSEQSSNELSSDENIGKVKISTKQYSPNSSSCQESDDEMDTLRYNGDQVCRIRSNNKRQRVSKHNMNEHERREIESVLFEELAQEDDDEDDENDNDDSLVEVEERNQRSRCSSDSLDDDIDPHRIHSIGYPVAKEDDDESEDEDADSDRPDDPNSHMGYFKPDGTPWANEEEKNSFFDNLINQIDQESDENESSNDESEDCELSDDEKIPETTRAVLKFFELHERKNDDPEESAKLKKLFDTDDTDLSDEAQEEARKTRILVQSIYSVSTILNKYPLQKALKLEKKAKKIEDECTRLRNYLLSKGFPEDKLPSSITSKK